jgi:hypothetical protein
VARDVWVDVWAAKGYRKVNALSRALLLAAVGLCACWEPDESVDVARAVRLSEGATILAPPQLLKFDKLFSFLCIEVASGWEVVEEAILGDDAVLLGPAGQSARPRVFLVRRRGGEVGTTHMQRITSRDGRRVSMWCWSPPPEERGQVYSEVKVQTDTEIVANRITWSRTDKM